MGEIPVDKGWAWCVLAGAFMNTFFVIGGLKSMGIMFVQVVEHFDASPALTGWMIGLMSFGMSVCAPIATAIGIRYTYRIVVICGAVLMSLGFFLTAFSPNIYFVVVILGIFIGVSNGFQFTPSVIMVGEYFERYRSIAMGIVMAGGSVGQLVIPVLIRFLLDEVSFFGCCLIFSAVVTHCILGGMLLRPQSFYHVKTSVVKRSTDQDVKTQDLDNCDSGGAVIIQTVNEPNVINVTPTPSLNSLTFRTEISHNLTSTPMVGGGGKPQDMCQDIELTQNLTIINAKKCLRVDDTSVVCPSLTVDEVDNNDMDSTSEIRKFSDSDATPKTEEVPAQSSSKSSVCSKICSPFTTMLDRSVTRSYMFWMYNVAICFANAGYLCQFFVLPSYAKEIDISKQQIAWILSVAGIVDLFGRILGGIINNLRLIKTKIFVSLSLILTAGSISICLFIPSFTSMLAHAIMLGLLGGMYIALYPVALVDVMGLERFPKAFSLMITCMGLLILPLPTIFGMIFSHGGSYLPSLWICTLLMLTAGILVLFEPLARRLDEKRQIRTFQTKDAVS